MAQERERGEGVSHSVDPVKRGRGFLSFRSRKLLSSLSNRNDVNKVSKLAAAAPETESIQPVRSDILGKGAVRHEGTKISLEPWSPRKIATDPAVAKLNGRKTKKHQQVLPVKDKLEKEGKIQKDVVVVTPSKQQLSPKLKLLEIFYEGLEAASSLLRIRHQMCTFKAVCKIVESISKRRFLFKHLAQIKHIFSEVLQLEYVRCQDPDSWGEKWDLRIILLPFSSDLAHSNSPLKGSAGQTGATVRRRKEFRARLLNFARAHPEDSDIPQESLPPRPLGGQLIHSSSREGQPASPSNRMILESVLSDQRAASPDAESSSHAEDFQFSIVKPSRASTPVPLEGTSHFPTSFKPFFSATRPIDGVPGQFSNSDGTLPLGSHFPASWRPFFSVQHTAEAINAMPVQLSKPLQPEETVPCEPCGKGIETKFDAESGDGLLPSCPVSSDQLETATTTHFPLSFTPLFSLNSKNLPQVSTSVQSTPKVLHGNSHASPVPVCTPPFTSPVNNTSRTAQDFLQLETPPTNFSSHSLPPKSQGIMRSLRFASPVKLFASGITSSSPGSSPQNTSPSDKDERISVQESPSLTPSTPAQTLPSYQTVEASSSPFTPPTTALQEMSSLLSPTKSSKSRSLQFNTPPKACHRIDVISPEDSNLVTEHGIPSSAAAKPLHFVPRPGSLMSRSPQTPGLQTPVRTLNSKEALYSPPKRAKLSRVSLFAEGHKDKDHEITSVSILGDVCGTKSSSEVIAPFAAVAYQQESWTPPKAQPVAADVCQQESSTPTKTKQYPGAKDIRGISQSDLDIIQTLPLDLVKSVQEKERKIKDESSREVAKQKRRQQMMGGVPKLFSQLRLIFQSVNRSVLPRHELVKSILSSHPDITDKGEVEERLQLIIELAPDYITTRLSLSGEPLYRIEKRANVVQIQRRLSGVC